MVADSILILASQMAVAILAGLLLNLTPCVLPAIPIKVRTILRESGNQRSHRIVAATAFLLGTLSLFLALGALTAFLQWNWGTLFQSTTFIGLLVVVLLAFAAMTWFDVPIPVPQFAATAHGHRYFEAFISGLLSAVLAAPCAGPFLGGVLAFAVTQPTSIILLLFAGIGLGLAFPYMALTCNPHWLAKLPKSGPWTLAVREMLAFVLLAAAVFFSASLLPAWLQTGLWWLWLALVLIWAIVRSIKGRAAVRVVTSMVAAVAVATTLMLTAAGQDPTETGIHWEPYSAAKIQQVREEHTPHLLEFTADWCINCKVLERSVYASAEVASVIRETGVVPIQVDLTVSEPAQDQLLTESGGHALPFAVVINARGEAVARFTGLFEQADLIRALREGANQ